VSVTLAIGALDNVTFTVRGFECDFAVMKVLDLVNVLIGGGRLQIHEEHGKREFSSSLFDVPYRDYLVAEVLNFFLDGGGFDRVVHMLQHHPVVTVFLWFVGVEGSLFFRQGVDYGSVGFGRLGLYLDLILGKGLGFICAGRYLFQ
jgi:hypothetical protein